MTANKNTHPASLAMPTQVAGRTPSAGAAGGEAASSPASAKNGQRRSAAETNALRQRIADLYRQGKDDKTIADIVDRSPESVRKHRHRMRLTSREWTAERRVRQAEAARALNAARAATVVDDQDGWPRIDRAAIARMEANFGRKLWADDARDMQRDYGRLPPRETMGRAGCSAALCADIGMRATGAWA